MDNRVEVRDFLRTRRNRLTPAQVGLTAGDHRRVPGLRRDDVAILAGMSIDYYAKIERGNLAGVSPEVLDALARALRLDATETEHLQDLARAARLPADRRRVRPEGVSLRPSLQRMLDAITGAPACVVNQRGDIVATNELGRALLAPLLVDPANQHNLARFIFLSPAARTYYPEWDAAADMVAATMRFAAGRHPDDACLSSLIEELSRRSDAFRMRWSAHDVRVHSTGSKRINHPEVGELEFAYDGLELPDYPGWMLYTYTTAPGSSSDERVRRLAHLAAGSGLRSSSSGAFG